MRLFFEFWMRASLPHNFFHLALFVVSLISDSFDIVAEAVPVAWLLFCISSSSWLHLFPNCKMLTVRVRDTKKIIYARLFSTVGVHHSLSGAASRQLYLEGGRRAAT